MNLKCWLSWHEGEARKPSKLRIKTINKIEKKTVLQLWSQIGQKMTNSVYNMTLKKKFKNK